MKLVKLTQEHVDQAYQRYEMRQAAFYRRNVGRIFQYKVRKLTRMDGGTQIHIHLVVERPKFEDYAWQLDDFEEPNIFELAETVHDRQCNFTSLQGDE